MSEPSRWVLTCSAVGFVVVAAYLVKRLLLDQDENINEPTFPTPGEGLTFPEQGEIKSVEGVILRTYTWPPRPKCGKPGPNITFTSSSPPIPPRAILLFLPAVGSHGERGVVLGEGLCRAGYLTTTFDYAGFGGSGGKRGYIKDITNLCTDALRYAKTLTQQYPGIPIFLVGQSTGATIALSLAIEDPALWAGMVLLSPVVRPTFPAFVYSSINFLSWLVCGNWKLCPSLPLNKFSSNPACVQYLKNDSKMYKDKFTLHTYLQLCKIFQYVSVNLHRVKTPFLVLHGSEDEVNLPGETAYVLKHTTSLKGTSKAYLTLAKTKHDLLLCQDTTTTVLDNCGNWMDERMRLAELAKSLD